MSESAEVRVFTSDLDVPPSAVARSPGVPTEYLPARRFFGERLIFPWRLWPALRRFAPHAVWTNQPSITGDLAGIFAIATRRPWVATYHADIAPDHWYSRPYNWLEAALLRWAASVEVTSPRYARKMLERGIRANRIAIAVPGPYIFDGSPPNPDELTTRSRSSPAATRYLFVGTLDPGHSYKRLDRLIDAIATLRQGGVSVELDIVGDGPSRPGYEEQARHRGLDGRVVRFWGRLDDAALADRFARASALVLSADSESEGFGSVAVEAAFFGCPTVASSTAAAGELLAEYGCAIVFDGTRPNALTEALGELARNPSTLDTLSAGTRDAASSLSWTRRMPDLLRPLRLALALA